MADPGAPPPGQAGASPDRPSAAAKAGTPLPAASAAQLIEAAPDAILAVDVEGRMELVNRQAELLFGYSRAELLGAPIETLIPARFSQAHAEHRSLYFSSPRARAMGEGLELYGRRKDGSEFPVDVSLTAIDTASGRFAAAFVRDVTDRKAAESRILQANRDLEAFSHTISHDLRAPLRSMRGFSRALLEDYAGSLDNKGRDYLARIDRAGASMERLIDDLLEYSRIGRREVETRAVDLEAVLREAMRPLAPDVERTHATIEVRRPLAPVTAEPDLLAQVLSNLLTNALKYVDPGKPPRVAVWTTNGPDFVRVHVADEGIGIAREHLERIWKPFERLHGRGAYPGTGVGLAIVDRAVERMGGRVGVESEPGRGSLFWIELRAAKGGKP